MFHQSPAHTLLMLGAIHVSFIIDNPACTCNVYHTHYKEVSHSLTECVHVYMRVCGCYTGLRAGRIGSRWNPNCKSAISFTLLHETWDPHHIVIPSHDKQTHTRTHGPTTLPPSHHITHMPSLPSPQFMSHSLIHLQTIYGN